MEIKTFQEVSTVNKKVTSINTYFNLAMKIFLILLLYLLLTIETIQFNNNKCILWRIEIIHDFFQNIPDVN